MDALDSKTVQDQVRKAQDRRFRRLLLVSLRELPPTASSWVPVAVMLDFVAGSLPSDCRFENDTHCIVLCRDLLILGMVEERLSQRRRKKLALDQLEYRLSAKGLGLILETVPPEPLIDDDRIA